MFEVGMGLTVSVSCVGSFVVLSRRRHLSKIYSICQSSLGFPAYYSQHIIIVGAHRNFCQLLFLEPSPSNLSWRLLRVCSGSFLRYSVRLCASTTIHSMDFVACPYRDLPWHLFGVWLTNITDYVMKSNHARSWHCGLTLIVADTWMQLQLHHL